MHVNPSLFFLNFAIPSFATQEEQLFVNKVEPVSTGRRVMYYREGRKQISLNTHSSSWSEGDNWVKKSAQESGGEVDSFSGYEL